MKTITQKATHRTGGEMAYYKFLSEYGLGERGRWPWPLPIKNKDGSWTSGDWTPALNGDPINCKYGYHFCELPDLPVWCLATLYELEVEPGGMVIRYDDKSATTARCRLVRQIEAWDERTARIFACDCAVRVLPIFERKRPGDLRPRWAIETARRYVDGHATDAELAAAVDAAQDAAMAAAMAVAGDADWLIARDAAKAAASAAARNAALGAARGAASFVARSANYIFHDTERQWQADHLAKLLDLEGHND
jgi:hypothetical protein